MLGELTIKRIVNENISSRPVVPLVIDFSREWHKYLFNWEELGAEIVDLSAEGVPLSIAWRTKALKFSVGAGETKYLKLTLGGEAEEQQCYVYLYLTGDVKAEWQGAWTGTNAVLNIQNGWYLLISRINAWQDNAIKFTATNGGVVYIGFVAIPINSEYAQLVSYPNLALDGATTYTYYVMLPHHGRAKGVARIWARIAGDGVNAINVDVYVLSATDNTWKLIASWSRTSSTIALYSIKIPYKMFSEPPNDIQFINIKFVVSGYGTFERYGVNRWLYDELVTAFNGKVTASASNVSTTVTRYTLIDNNGRGNRYLQGTVSLSSPAGGIAILYINGKQVADFSGSSGTFNIPENLDIWKVEVDLAGDGTTPATADFDGLEVLGAYIVRR